MSICGFLYGMTEPEWGRFPNIVRVLTVGNYNYCMVLPCLSVSIMLCVTAVLSPCPL